MLRQLKSKISSLESSIVERSHGLRSKDESIEEMGKIIREKLETISSLQTEMESLQPEGSRDGKEAHVWVSELEKQVDTLKREIVSQNKMKDELETRASVAEKKIQELNFKLESLQKVNDEQNIRIHKTELALQVAQEEMMKAKLDGRARLITEAHEEWPLHWLTYHVDNIQHYIVSHWNEHGRPALDFTYRKVFETKAQVGKWAKPCMVAIANKWIPMLKEQSLTCIAYPGTCIPSPTTKAIQLYHGSMKSLMQQVANVHKMADPYMREAKKFTEPYINQVAKFTKPHIDTVCTILMPYATRTLDVYKNFIQSATLYHQQVQQTLKSNELMRPLATMELAWFLATAILSLPVIFIFRFCSAVFRKKAKKQSHSSHINHMRHRAKRSRSAE